MGAALGIIVAVAFFGCLIYLAFGAYASRRYPRNKDGKP
jgi:hypothetical protein